MGSIFFGVFRFYRGFIYWNVQVYLWDRMTLFLCVDVRNLVRSKIDMVFGVQVGFLMFVFNSCVGVQIQVEGVRVKGNFFNVGGYSSWVF